MSNIVIKNCPLRKDCEWDCEECGIVAETIAANNAKWVEWIEANLFRETDSGLVFHHLPKYVQQDWQERKKEVGL